MQYCRGVIPQSPMPLWTRWAEIQSSIFSFILNSMCAWVTSLNKLFRMGSVHLSNSFVKVLGYKPNDRAIPLILSYIKQSFNCQFDFNITKTSLKRNFLEFEWSWLGQLITLSFFNYPCIGGVLLFLCQIFTELPTP